MALTDINALGAETYPPPEWHVSACGFLHRTTWMTVPGVAKQGLVPYTWAPQGPNMVTGSGAQWTVGVSARRLWRRSEELPLFADIVPVAFRGAVGAHGSIIDTTFTLRRYRRFL